MLRRDAITLIFSLLLTFLLVQASFAGDATKAANKLDALIVYGEGFAFSVKEPSGWKGDTANANHFSANIIFYPATQTSETANTIIRVLITDKTDENINQDVEHDMGEYRAKYPKIIFRDVAASHPQYQVYPKLFTVPDSFYEYVAYVNPGPAKRLMFSVSMNKQGKDASVLELDTYRKIIASLQML